MKKQLVKLLISALVIGVLCGCGNTSQESTETTAQLEEEAAAEEADRIAEEEAAAETARIAEEAARQEEANIYYEAGRACLYGLDGQEISYAEAYMNFEKALELGKTEANFYLGALYDWYGYPEKNFEKASEYYEADSDNPYAQLSLGFLYYNGQGVEEDTEKGQELFDAVIASGCVEGYLGSASIAEHNEDYDTALDCYNKVLEGDEQLYIASAMADIGVLYYNGNGVEQDYALAMEWFEKAADLGDVAAIYNIGYMYYNGIGVEQDYALAMEWYEKVADLDLGNTTALWDIVYMYVNGLGVEQDYALAMEWLEKAADLGDAGAIFVIGGMYENGMGVEQDYALAMEWYEKAADLGSAEAINNIGVLYYNGMGVEQDYAIAYEWFEKAADLGSADAMEWIEYMDDMGLH